MHVLTTGQLGWKQCFTPRCIDLLNRLVEAKQYHAPFDIWYCDGQDDSQHGEELGRRL